MPSVRQSVHTLLEGSKEKKRNFIETIELQIGLKNYDPQRDKRFSGTIKLPNLPRPRMSICILADAADIDRAKLVDLEYQSVDDLKKLNKNKKLVKVRLALACIQREGIILTDRMFAETRQEIRRFPCFRGSHQADPSSVGSWSIQG